MWWDSREQNGALSAWDIWVKEQFCVLESALSLEPSSAGCRVRKEQSPAVRQHLPWAWRRTQMYLPLLPTQGLAHLSSKTALISEKGRDMGREEKHMEKWAGGNMLPNGKWPNLRGLGQCPALLPQGTAWMLHFPIYGAPYPALCSRLPWSLALRNLQFSGITDWDGPLDISVQVWIWKN